MTRSESNFEDIALDEIELSDRRFTVSLPTNEEIGNLYLLASKLAGRFAREIGNALYDSSQGRALSARKISMLQLYDSRKVWQLVYEYSLATEQEPGYQTIGVRDGQGNLQAGAIINASLGEFVYVKHFATSPWNILGSDFDERAVKNAGTSLMELIVRYSRLQGFEGTVKLVSKERAVSFYTKLGFRRDANLEDLLVLTPESASSFLANR